MAEKTAAVDSEKGATLEQISAMVEQISREFKSKMIQVQPLMQELKVALKSTYSYQVGTNFNLFTGPSSGVYGY